MDLTEILNDLLPLFNIFSLITFVSLAALAGSRMTYRLSRFMKFSQPVPILLKRDIVLFGALTIYFGSVLIVLGLQALGVEISSLGDKWWWVMPRGLMVLSAMAYWVWVEYNLEGD